MRLCENILPAIQPIPHTLRLHCMKKLPGAVGRQTPSLLFCIVMDLIGYASYAIPILGEFGDVLWAPISALIFFKTFGGWKGALGGAVNFIEELLPGLDFIPTFTITWFLTAFKKEPTKTYTIINR